MDSICSDNVSLCSNKSQVTVICGQLLPTAVAADANLKYQALKLKWILTFAYSAVRDLSAFVDISGTKFYVFKLRLTCLF